MLTPEQIEMASEAGFQIYRKAPSESKVFSPTYSNKDIQEYLAKFAGAIRLAALDEAIAVGNEMIGGVAGNLQAVGPLVIYRDAIEELKEGK